MALPRCLRAAKAQAERQLLPGHSLAAGDQQQGGFELVDLCADQGHQRQRGTTRSYAGTAATGSAKSSGTLFLCLGPW